VIVYSGSFFENCRVSPHFWGYIFPRLRLCINVNRNGLGYVLGDFFINSLGQPDPDPFIRALRQGDQMSLSEDRPKNAAKSRFSDLKIDLFSVEKSCQKIGLLL
jgi:hypothetical protein